MTQYYLGIDGGGTKTKVSVIDQNKTLIYEGVGGPSSTDTVDQEGTIQSINEALKGLQENVYFDGVFCGIGGVLTQKDFDQVKALFVYIKGIQSKTQITVRNDMENALASGKLFKEGIVLIAGTGMVAYGKDLFGNTYKSGGWGYKEGDFGSAFDMGYQSIRMAIKSIDGRIQPSLFTHEVKEKIGLLNQDDIVPVVDYFENRRTDVAKLAKLVTKHADLGDPNAITIVEKATSDLADAVGAVHQNINLTEKKMVIVGTLGNSGGIFQERLYEKIKEKEPMMRITGPLIDPSFAAAWMALTLKRIV